MVEELKPILKRMSIHMLRLQEAMPFDPNQLVKVPTEVHPSGRATIVGSEWSGGKRLRDGLIGDTWVYFLRFSEGGEWWKVTEEELIQWQA